MGMHHLIVVRLSSCRRLDFMNITEAELKALADYCDPATFGRSSKDVYDETYRKAGKLDRQHFSTNLVPHESGLLASLQETLLEGHSKETSMHCELYKLNVYGTFFCLALDFDAWFDERFPP